MNPDYAQLDLLGKGEGMWWVPTNIAPDSIAYCAGIGLDATYDFDLSKEKGLKVYSFDPTPSSIDYMEKNNQDNGVEFHPWGLMGHDKVTRFFAPIDIRHQSWFTENLHRTSQFFDAECLTVGTIMERLKHTHINLLKLDIEGSWYDVLNNMIDNDISPDTLCIEFDSPAPLSRVRKITKRLEKSGYKAVAANGDNVVFVL